MPFLDTRQQRASLLIVVLGAWLLWTLWPYSTGLIGGVVLYVLFAPLHRELSQSMPKGLAAGVVILLILLLIVGPGIWLVAQLAVQAQSAATGLLNSPLIERIQSLRIAGYDVGDYISQSLERIGSSLASWVGSSALGLVGAATRLIIQLTIAFFGLYYMLMNPGGGWAGLRPFIPFSRANAEALRKRFSDVTISTVVGTFLTAIAQGTLVGVGFAITGLSNPLFWGSVTVIASILPVVGSGIVWVPGALALALGGRYGAAIGLALIGLLVVGSVDNLIRPFVYRRYAQIHPFITVIGAFAGIAYFGLLGLLIGPLAISYFFELIRMYRQEYLDDDAAVADFTPQDTPAPGRPVVAPGAGRP